MNKQGDVSTTRHGWGALRGSSRWAVGVAGTTFVLSCSSTDEWPGAPGDFPESKLEREGAAADGASELDPNDPHADDVLWQRYQRARREFAGNFGEPIGQFAAKCDLATGIHVPDFKCSTGTLVPTTHLTTAAPQNTCDRPEQLHQKCDPGSRFQIVASSANAAAILHCRRGGNPDTGNAYHDIAIIQYNWVNGATCYYQALGAALDGDFKAPALGSSTDAEITNPNASPWASVSYTHSIDCRSCHDNSAIIRSPYMSQMRTAPNALPGAANNMFNRNNPVAYVGKDFQDWQLYSVNLTGNGCLGCHRLGYSNTPEGATAEGMPGPGTALTFGVRATNHYYSNIAKNADSANSPLWMLMGQTEYDEDNHVAAVAVQTCALALKNGTTPPPGCSSTPLSTLYKGLDPAQLYVTL